jgi:hypothetical protein
MALTYTYPDAYLQPFCTEDREDRALADVAVMAGSRTFSASYIERLTIVQTYIIACMENQADAEDLFTAKLKTYRAQIAILLPQAIADADATADVQGAGVALFSIPLERA